MFARVTTAIVFAALVALSVVRVLRPPALVPATAPDTVFSAERAMQHVAEIAAHPHALSMADHDRVRDYVVGELTRMGLNPQIQRTTAISTLYQSAGRVENIVAWIPGADTAGKAVLLMAHYDGVEAGPAASDDGAGTAALLETLRALKARKQPFQHDIIALFTDGEEAGLLGAAAFVREHRWAKDVAVALNFEARGTTGRSFMFETGPGNLDAARALRRAGNATAGSVFTTVYRALPNDTDLSELALLHVPALNFAFAGGVERYHTSHDDVADLNPGSVQHHGVQMLALAKIFASDTLPRPTTSDAVFFDLPLIGLVVYPVALSIPLAVLGAILAAIVAWRERRRALVGAGAVVLAVLVSACIAWLVGSLLLAIHAHLAHGGDPEWRGIYAMSIALFVIAACLAIASFARRWGTPPEIHAGVLVVWALLALVVSILSPAVGYLFAWPVLFAAGAELLPSYRVVGRWIAAAVTILMLAGLVVGVSVVMLGLAGPGAIAAGIIIALIAMLVLPLLDVSTDGLPWSGAGYVAGAGVIVMAIGLLTVRESPAHPVPTALLYLENADTDDAWLTGFGSPTGAWLRSALGAVTPLPAWANRIAGNGRLRPGRRVARVPLDAPDARFVRDTIIGGARRVVFRITAPRGAAVVALRASGAPVLTSSIDGRVVDTTRYRRRYGDWVMEYWAVPDSGAVVALSIPPGKRIDVDVASRTPGLPVIPGTTIPQRPPYVVPIQTGDASIVYRRHTF
jgi:MFS family permease